MQKISIIIPAHNEEKGIANVIKTIRSSSIESEIIVVNNCSTDKTVEEAEKGGADKIVHCDKKGKGYAMEEGLKQASREIIIFIDGDLKIENNRIVEMMVNPILLENVDFVKSTFDRGIKLIAPVKGNMNKNILESISATILVTLKRNEKIIFSDTSTNCGIEIVKS